MSAIRDIAYAIWIIIVAITVYITGLMALGITVGLVIMSILLPISLVAWLAGRIMGAW